MAFVTTISQGGSFATTVTQGGSTWTLDQVSSPATFTASIATLGPKGDKGDQGDQGETGPQGPTGPAGAAATVAVGTVTTLDPGDPVTVVNSGTSAAAILDFGIPQGEKGDKGDKGDTGNTGPQGIPGVISATSPITYNAGTQTVGFDTTWNPFNQDLNTGDQVEFSSVRVDGPSGAARGLFYNGIYATNSGASVGVILSETGVNIFGGADLRFPDSSVQTTAYLGGDLKAANNLSDLANAGTARSNLGLGTMATEAAADYLAKAGNLAGLADLSASRSNLGLGTMATEAAANYAAKASSNTFTADQVIETTSTGAALRVTQLGTGEALRVEDAANPDASPFVVTSDGSVGIGVVPPSGWKLYIPSGANYFGTGGFLSQGTSTIRSITSSVGLVAENISTGPVATFANTATATSAAVTITNLGTGNSFVVNDEASDISPFVIQADGTVCIGTTTPQVAGYKLSVTGPIVSINGAAQLYHGSAGLSLIQTGGAFNAFTIENRGSGASLQVLDQTSPDTTPFIVDAGGNVGVKTAAPGTDFEVNGNAKFTTGEIVTAPAAGDSSAKIPTTAWVQAEVPAASTTVAGKVELATDVEALAGTSTNTAITPRVLLDALLSSQAYSIPPTLMSAATSGTGANTGSTTGGPYGRLIAPNAGVTGFATRGTSFWYQSNSISAVCNFSKPSGFSFRIYTSLWTIARTDVIARLWLGNRGGVITVSNTTDRGYGIEYNFSTSSLSLIAHNGTTLTTKAVSASLVNFRTYEFSIISDGAGTITLYIDGVLTDSTTGGPTGYTGQGYIWYQADIQNTSANSPANTDIYIVNPKAYWVNG